MLVFDIVVDGAVFAKDFIIDLFDYFTCGQYCKILDDSSTHADLVFIRSLADHECPFVYGIQDVMEDDNITECGVRLRYVNLFMLT